MNPTKPKRIPYWPDDQHKRESIAKCGCKTIPSKGEIDGLAPNQIEFLNCVGWCGDGWHLTIQRKDSNQRFRMEKMALKRMAALEGRVKRYVKNQGGELWYDIHDFADNSDPKDIKKFLKLAVDQCVFFWTCLRNGKPQ